jgi:1-acyl-sn-glycerol-3-phosphate acyltransferase
MKGLFGFFGSLVYTVLFFLSVLVFGFVVLLPNLIINERMRWRVLTAFAQTNIYMCKYLCDLDHEVIGLENIPNKPCIVFLKHSSVYELFFALSFFQPSSYVAKYELMFVPVIRGAIKAMKCIPVKRGLGRKEVSKVVAKGEKYLNEGRWLVICPEGTRVRYGETRKYGLSGAVLAKGTGKPVLPVAHNAGYFWGRRSLVKKPGKITFSIGSQLTTKGLDVSEINKGAQEWIEKEITGLG